ncbi:ATP-binding protein [Sulfobacillus harzensis]|uniref:ATP-binding protein n=1 Tax=Sulfobacillus harzensis TaxID=2729629 RepID=UPI003B83A26B
MADISREDNGPGVPTESRNGYLIPPFTTKSNGHGLGLSAVHANVRQHGGSIWVSSAPGPCFICFARHVRSRTPNDGKHPAGG